MEYTIREFVDHDIADIVELSLSAWEPVFISFAQILGAKIYSNLYPDWRKSHIEGIEGVCGDKTKYIILVAQCDRKVVGFLAYEIKQDDQNKGEVVLLAVHPEYQKNGIGTALNKRALENMKHAGVKIAVVETGGDPSHGPARKSYEKSGYRGLPIMRYYQEL